MADTSATSQLGIKALQDLVLAVNANTQAIKAVFPQGQAVTASAGSSAGKYLTIIGTDGVTYKIALLLPS